MVTSGTGHPGARLLAPGPLGARDATVSGDDEKISKIDYGFKRKSKKILGRRAPFRQALAGDQFRSVGKRLRT